MGTGKRGNMQKWIGSGVRFTMDPEVRYTAGDNAMAIARGRVACNRRGKKEGQQEADFIPVVGFGRTAEFIEKYIRKGSKVNIEGRLTSGSYTNKEGQKVYTLEVTIDDIEFAESKTESEARQSGGNGGFSPVPGSNNNSNGNGFVNIPDGIDEEYLFNN